MTFLQLFPSSNLYTKLLEMMLMMRSSSGRGNNFTAEAPPAEKESSANSKDKVATNADSTSLSEGKKSSDVAKTKK
jgi:hypothetical protein